jgi:hypothetical protein
VRVIEGAMARGLQEVTHLGDKLLSTHTGLELSPSGVGTLLFRVPWWSLSSTRALPIGTPLQSYSVSPESEG